jgi:ethanolamine transporter EutH
VDETVLFEPADPESDRSRTVRLAVARHRGVLGICAVVVVLAPALQVLPDRQHVAIRGLARYPAPHVCTSRTWLGVNCPGCGLTRSLVYLAHGDWRASLRAHRLGWMIGALVVFQLPYRVLQLRRPDRPFFGPRACQFIVIAVIALLVGNWLLDCALGRTATAVAPRPQLWF